MKAKISILLACCLSIFLSLELMAQSKTMPLKDALALLSTQFGINFSYSSDKIDLNKKVQFSELQKNLTESLNDLASQANFKWRRSGNSILLIPAKRSGSLIQIHGRIREESSNELLPDIVIQNLRDQQIILSNHYGFFSMSFPYSQDSVKILFSSLGFERKLVLVSAEEDVDLDVYLKRSNIQLDSINIEEERVQDKAFHRSVNIEKLDAALRDAAPQFLGEKDAMASTRFISGVNRETDISSGFTIRGGRIDQNLVILDDAPIYHSFHSFGIYSIFNDHSLKQMSLIKSGFPARYGGRLSSVIEVITKEGDMNKFHADLGTGFISSKLSVEGPIVKDKLSFFLSARTSHIQQIARLIIDDPLGYNFGDFNLKLNYRINAKNQIFLSAYRGQDGFRVAENNPSNPLSNRIDWGNRTSTLRWNYNFNPRWFSNLSVIYTRYKVSSFQGDSSLNFQFGSEVEDFMLKHDLDYYLSSNHHLKMGYLWVDHYFDAYRFLGSNAIQNIGNKQVFRFSEYAAYLEDEYLISNTVAVNAGLRFSGYIGEDARNSVEPRLMATWLFAPKYSVKASFSRMAQYAHFLNSAVGIGLPTDLWLPSNNRLRPEKSDQISAGVFYNDKKNWKVGVEAYYKQSENVVNYGANANLLLSILYNTVLNDSDVVSDVISGRARSYGVETQIEYRNKYYTGLLAYTLSYSYEQFNELNDGLWFFASNDRRHNVSLLNAFRLSNAWTINLTWVYTTGIPFTFSESSYIVNAHEPGNISDGFGLGPNSKVYFINNYTGTNVYRMSAYHRLDVGATYKKTFHQSELTLNAGIVNVYNRRNPIYYFVNNASENDNRQKLYKAAFVGIIPSFSINWRF